VIKRFAIFFLVFFIQFTGFSQIENDRFYLTDNEESEKLSFIESSSQIIIKVRINGSTPMNFLLDSGVKTAMIFNIPQKDTLSLHNYQITRVRGLGDGDGMDAIVSRNNVIQIGDHIRNDNLTIYMLLDEFHYFNNKLGHEIHGIIGYDLFKDFIIELNYDHKFLRINDPNSFEYPTWFKFKSFPLTFHKDKPYLDLIVEQEKGDTVKVRLLVDTGGSDALWLFQHSHSQIDDPDNFIDDFLGLGLSGDIFGKRSRIAGLHLGDFSLEDITVSYPDSNSVSFVMLNKDRNGSIGGLALSQFRVIMDYPNKKISFRKGKKFGQKFHYNMSGIEFRKPFKELPIYEITNIRRKSSAEKVGLKVGDQIKYVNGKSVVDMNYQEIMSVFSQKEGRELDIIVFRNGEELNFSFILEKFI
jgi:hypothetical protein